MKPVEFQRSRIGEGIYYTVCLNPKFKVNRITVNCLLPMEETSAAAFAVLACLLTKNCRTCPDITDFSARLDALYGADLYGDVSKIGDSQVISFTAECIDDRFAMEKEPLTAEITGLLLDAILDPVLGDHTFPESSFQVEKQFLLDSALAELNNKRSYAVRRFNSVMFEGESGSVDKLGSPERISSLTGKEAFDAWQKLLHSASFEIFFTGCDHAEAAREVLTRRLAETERFGVYVHQAARHQPRGTVRRVTEQMDVRQAKLVVGYALDEESCRDKNVLRMLNCVLGSSPGSRFFLHIREEQSLCYYCPSRINGIQGCLIADSGVELSNAEKVEEAIQKEIADLQTNGCTEEELAAARRYMITAMRTVPDSVSSMESWNFNRVLAGNQDIETDRDAIASVTAEQIQAAARGLKKDTVYLLSAKEKQNDAV